MESDSFSDGIPDDVLAEYQEHVKQGNITWERALQSTEKEVCSALEVLLVVQYNLSG